jgi:hypothetical protein
LPLDAVGAGVDAFAKQGVGEYRVFKQIKLIPSVNRSLAELGIDPGNVDKDSRRPMQIAAVAEELTGQEVATIIFSRMPIGMTEFGVPEAIIQLWVREGKLRPHKLRGTPKAYRLVS